MLQGIFFKFLLMPLIAIVLIGAAAILKRKNALVSNKKLIVFGLLYSLAMCIPGFLGFINAPFAPWLYLLSIVVYLVLGTSFVQLYSVYFQNEVKSYKVLFQLSLMLVIMAFSWYLFALLFNWGSDVGGYTAATCILIFPLPLIFYWTYVAFINIPYEIYKVWHYPVGAEDINFEGKDFNALMVIDLEFSRQPDDRNRLHVKAKAPADLPFGLWFKKFIDDYNTKFPNQTIASLNEHGDPFGWVFYSKRSFFHRRRLLDPDITIEQNKVREHVTIISKRVIEHSEEKSYSKSNLILQA